MKARRRRGLLLLSVALVSGGLAASEVRERERSVEERLGPAVRVLAAARGLAARTRVTRADLAIRHVPARFVPPGALASAAGVVGARTAVPVPAGGYLTAELLARRSPAEPAGLGRGQRAVTVEVVADAALAALAPGAPVDVLISTESAAGAGRTSMALTDVELLQLEPASAAAADPEAGFGGPVARATLLVPLQEAIRLTEADNFAREIRLLARPPEGG